MKEDRCRKHHCVGRGCRTLKVRRLFASIVEIRNKTFNLVSLLIHFLVFVVDADLIPSLVVAMASHDESDSTGPPPLVTWQRSEMSASYVSRTSDIRNRLRLGPDEGMSPGERNIPWVADSPPRSIRERFSIHLPHRLDFRRNRQLEQNARIQEYVAPVDFVDGNFDNVARLPTPAMIENRLIGFRPNSRPGEQSLEDDRQSSTR